MLGDPRTLVAYLITLLGGLSPFACGGESPTVPTSPEDVPTFPAPQDAVAPDIADNASFETGWDRFASFGGGAPRDMTRDDAVPAADGSWSVRREFGVADGQQLTQFGLRFDSQQSGELWFRFWVRFTAVPTADHKLARMQAPGFGANLGGLATRGSSLRWSFDREVRSQLIPLGIENISLNRWHCIEVHYRRNGDPSPNVAVWYDDKPVQGSNPPSPARWTGGRLYAGERNGDFDLGLLHFSSVLNGPNRNTGQMNFDKISISTQGRIGC